MRISDWSSDVCSSDLKLQRDALQHLEAAERLVHVAAADDRLVGSPGRGGGHGRGLMPDSFLVVALGLDPRVQGKRRSGRPGCSARGPRMTGKEAVRGDEESPLHLPAALEVAGRSEERRVGEEWCITWCSGWAADR